MVRGFLRAEGCMGGDAAISTRLRLNGAQSMGLEGIESSRFLCKAWKRLRVFSVSGS